MNEIEINRNFMKPNTEKIKNIVSDQMKNLPQPPLEKAFDENSVTIDLIPVKDILIENDNLVKNIENRKSHRKYSDEPITLEELSFLLIPSVIILFLIHRIWI